MFPKCLRNPIFEKNRISRFKNERLKQFLEKIGFLGSKTNSGIGS
jgi:hypothetical protein